MTDETLVATHARVIADVVAEHGGGAQLMLEQAQAGPLARLHHRSDDFDVWSWRPARQFLESYPGSPRKALAWWHKSVNTMLAPPRRRS